LKQSNDWALLSEGVVWQTLTNKIDFGENNTIINSPISQGSEEVENSVIDSPVTQMGDENIVTPAVGPNSTHWYKTWWGGLLLTVVAGLSVLFLWELIKN